MLPTPISTSAHNILKTMHTSSFNVLAIIVNGNIGQRNNRIVGEATPIKTGQSEGCEF